MSELEEQAGIARRLADEFSAIGARLSAFDDVDDVLGELAALALRLVPHADHAATSRRRKGRFETVGATSDVPMQVDSIQYRLGRGPCVDAILEKNMFNAPDLRVDPRWPDFGREAAESTGILSMLAFRLFFEDQPAADLQAGLNLYAAKPNAFDESDETSVLLVSTHGALAIAAATARMHARGLTEALQSNRDIGAAIGVLMARLLLTREQAFDLMRVASQRTNRRLRDIADQVLDSGTLEIPDALRRPAGGRPGR
jgi:hypothetical protein